MQFYIRNTPHIHKVYAGNFVYKKFIAGQPGGKRIIMTTFTGKINETFINGTAVEKTEEPAAIVALRAIAGEKKSFTSKFFVSSTAFKSYQAAMLALHSRVVAYTNATIKGEPCDTRDIAAAYHILSVMLRLCVDDRYVDTRLRWTNCFVPRFISAAGIMRHNGEYRVFVPCSLQTLFPACAGVILSSSVGKRFSISFPRVCGGDPA